MARPRVAELAGICLLVLARLSTALANTVARDSSEADPNFSNGTCYYSKGNEADLVYIPCGNIAFGIFSCCEEGSVCLDHNACYSSDGNTYLAGCTDPTYSDSSCPKKSPYDNQQWTGLVYCGDPSDEWTLCDDSGADSVTVTPWPGCSCPEDESSRNVAFTAPGLLANQILLPSSTGGSMSFFDGYSPSTVLISTAASTSATKSGSSRAPTSTSSTITSGPTTSASSAASTSSSPFPRPSQPTSNLSTGAKVGIGIGTGLGGLIVLAVIGAMAFYIRRLKQRQVKPEDAARRPLSELPAIEKDNIDSSTHRSPGWSGNTSELAGSDSRDLSSIVSPESTLRAWSRPMSIEIEGSIPKHHSVASFRSQELRDARPVYSAYKVADDLPVRAGGVAGSSTLSPASYRPGRQVGDGVYEMPAHLPESS